MKNSIQKRAWPERRYPVWVIVVADLLLLAAALLTFAYFHHVKPTTLRPDGTLTDPSDQLRDEWTKFAKINIEEKTKGEGASLITYYVADIYVSDVTYLKTFIAEDSETGEPAYGNHQDTIFNMAEQSNAILAINGDFYGFQRTGLVVRNGMIYRASRTSHDVCVLYYDGTMKTYLNGKYPSKDELTENGAYQAWTFGPSLLDEEGKARTDLDTLKFCSGIYGINPRTAMGYYEPGHYCFVVVDGRQDGHSVGVDMTELAEIFEELGCSVAYNLDGGRTAMMAYEGEYVNSPYRNGREVSDIVLIAGDNVDVTVKKDD